MDKKQYRNDSGRDNDVNMIIDLEWEMFQNVNNIGGRASCQDDWDTFYIMRYCQTKIMNDMTVKSYKADLEEAVLAGHNLVMEKYARMMQYTDPVYYENELKPNLPGIRAEKRKLANDIADRMANAEQKFAKDYPKFSRRGRPIEDETGGVTSLHTYADGELLTYSERTLNYLLNSIEKLEKKGENIAYIIHDETARFYGYDGVKQAEEAF